MKIFGLLTMVIFFISCSTHSQDNKSVNSNADSQILIDSKSESQIHLGRLNNDLIEKLQGEWINTELFDSTLTKKQLHPWLDHFYGDILLIIDLSDSVTINGNMDGGTGNIKIIDSVSFSFPDRVDEPIFTFSLHKDLIFERIGSNKPIIYRRINKTDRLDIIADENAFNQFFIDKFFTSDYFTDSERSKIVNIWDGFETYTPFNFDAVGFKGENDTTIYYAWKFVGDVLELYNTSFKYDDDSGFANFKIGKLNRRINKK
jgi:hypothetical protein